MANYCFTDYVVEGKVEEIDGFRQLLEKLPANGDERSLNVIRKAFGEVSGGDGSLYGIEKDGFTLVFSTCTRWQPANDVFVAVKRHFPSLRFYYYAEESNDEVFLTNDADRKYFKHFMMECGDDRRWFATEGEMLVALAKKLEISVPPTMDAAEDICDERNEKGIGSFLAVRKIEVEDEYGLGK